MTDASPFISWQERHDAAFLSSIYERRRSTRSTIGDYIKPTLSSSKRDSKTVKVANRSIDPPTIVPPRNHRETLNRYFQRTHYCLSMAQRGRERTKRVIAFSPDPIALISRQTRTVNGTRRGLTRQPLPCSTLYAVLSLFSPFRNCSPTCHRRQTAGLTPFIFFLDFFLELHRDGRREKVIGFVDRSRWTISAVRLRG